MGQLASGGTEILCCNQNKCHNVIMQQGFEVSLPQVVDGKDGKYMTEKMHKPLGHTEADTVGQMMMKMMIMIVIYSGILR